MMDARDMGWCVRATAGVLAQGDEAQRVTGVRTDSRRVGPGDVFVALRGERFDGHAFVGAVAGLGVAGVVVEAGWEGSVPKGVAALRVADTRVALGRLAAAYRAELAATVVAVAGSNGKTTTKELLGRVLESIGPVWWSAASFNNDVGVPLSLLEGSGLHRVGVLEAGTNHPGELAPLLGWMRPQVGVLTSIGREHLEFFGDERGVAREEGALAEAVGPGGLLVMQGDHAYADEIAGRCAGHVVRYGTGGTNDWRVTGSRSLWEGEEFEVQGGGPGWDGTWRVGVPGRVMASNATAALVVARELGVKPEQARLALAGFHAPERRMSVRVAGGVRVLDDCYNANADSVAAALETLGRLPCEGRRVAVLGDMAELGAASEAAHVEVGRCAAAGVDALVCVGRWSGVMAGAARAAGLGRVTEHAAVEGALEVLQGMLGEGDAILVKGSRSSRMERVTEGLLGRRGGGSC